MRRLFLPIVLVAILIFSPAGEGGQLPQNHPYQVTLRNYMASLRETDFDVSLQPLTYDPSFLPTLDDVHRHWLWHEAAAGKVTPHKGLRVNPYYFTLASIESRGRVNMGLSFFIPTDTAWWAQWNYPGNPHRPGSPSSAAVKRRAFVAAAVDLMMLDAYHEAGHDVRSDYMGGNLVWQAYAYRVAKDILPPEVRAAFETGLRKIFERIEGVYPYGPGGTDLEMFQMVGLWNAAEAMDDDNLRTRALARTQYVIDEIIMPAGYERHGGAFDCSYMGIALHFMTHAAMLYNDPKITATLAGMLSLKGHLTLPEPGATGFATIYVGPGHFNTGTSMTAPTDQWSTYYRDAAEGMMTDEGKYLAYCGRTWGAAYKPAGIRDEATMRANIVSWLTSINNTDGFTKPNAGIPSPWKEAHWGWGVNYSREYYRPGYHKQASRLLALNDPLIKPPFSRKGNFIKTFADDILAFKIGEFGGIIHTDTICDSWADHVSGLSGGCLSAFWTPTTGTILLGLNGGSQFPATYERWEWWDTWACHALSGVSESGLPFSSARNQNPVAQYDVHGTTAATVRVTGVIGQHDNGMSAPNNAITGQVRYERIFEITGDGLDVQTTLTSDGTDRVRELWEVLPIHLRQNDQSQDALIELETGGGWVAPTTNIQAGVTRLRVTRFGDSVYFVFGALQDVKLASSVNARADSRVQNVMIDLLRSGGAAVALPATTSVSYRIMIPAARLRITGSPDDFGRPTALGYGRYITNIVYGSMVTSQVAFITDTTCGARRVSAGWGVTNYAGVFSNGSGTQAVFQVATNTVLTWKWTNDYYLTVTSEPNGSIAWTSNWQRAGTEVELLATASNSHTFVDWTGDVPDEARTNNPLKLIMDEPRSVKARFGFGVRVTGAPSAHGAPTPYGYGTSSNLVVDAWVTNRVASPVEATNGMQYACSGWSLLDGAGVVLSNGAGTTAVFRVGCDAELRWIWNQEFQFTLSAGTGGTVTNNVGWYPAGASVTGSAAAAAGFIFAAWTGTGVPDGQDTNNPLTLTMDRPRSITARFAANAPVSRTWHGTGPWHSETNWLPQGVPGPEDTLAVTSGVCFVADPLRCASLSVGGGAALLMISNWDTFVAAETIFVRTNGTITLPPPFPDVGMSNRVRLVCTDLTIETGGSIDVNGCGYAGGVSLSWTNGAGLGRGKNGDGGGGGAGYGGYGADGTNTVTAGYPYGSAAAPETPGSGGGGSKSFAGTGGAGGGAVRVEAAGRVIVNGRITANGAAGTGRGGGGSGGAIFISCHIFSGTGGVVCADAGAAGINGGAAGGGRIAVLYDAATQAGWMPPDVRFSVMPTSAFYGAGDLGTIYFPGGEVLDPADISLWGELNLPGHCLEGTRLVFRNGRVRIGNDGYRLAATDEIVVDGTGTVVEIGMHGLVEARNLIVTNGARFNVLAGTPDGPVTSCGARVSISGCVAIASNSWLSPVSEPVSGGSVLMNVGDLHVAAFGGIDATGRGYGGGLGGEGLGPGHGFASTNYGSGGGYGGVGGRSLVQSGGVTYGSDIAPNDAGSGGGARSSLVTSTGGYGGGLILLVATGTVCIDGTIAADGGTGMNGGGSGGGIWIRCARLTGGPGGMVCARGGGLGVPTATNNGCGGGGRISIWRPVGADQYQGAYDVSGGTNGNKSGTAGTVMVMAPPFPTRSTIMRVAYLDHPLRFRHTFPRK